MKKIVTLIIGIIIFYSSNSQNKVVVFKIVSLQNEVVLLYENEIKIFDIYNIVVKDVSKVKKIKTMKLKEVIFFDKNGKNHQVFIQNFLASSVPTSELYIFSSHNATLYVARDSIVGCSPQLIMEINNTINK